MSGITKTTQTRRNGKSASCEACRKLRIRCGHEKPQCARCVKRGLECLYHPAPMTRAPTAVRQWHVSTVMTDGGVPRSAKTSVSMISPVTPTSPNKTRSEDHGLRTPQSVPGVGGLDPSIVPPKSNGDYISGADPQQDSYLGSTSYSAAFGDSHRGSVIPPDDMLDQQGTLTFTRFVTPETRKAEQDRISYGARLLKLLPTLPLAEELIDRYMRLSQVVIVPSKVVNHSLQSLRKMMDAFSTDEKCYAMSRKIFIETDKPLRYSEDMRPDQFHEYFTADHLRWEILGLLFTLIGLSCMTIGDETSFASTIVSSKIDWRILMEEMLLASNNIISFCYNCQTLNDMFVWLLHCNLTFLTMHRGESNHIVWRRLGDLSTAVYEMGLHQESGSEDTTPFFLKELRKRCFGTAYCADKAIATFLGRPPLISRQYSCQILPLDLDTSAMMAVPEELATHLADLDQEGWNRKDHFVRATFLRVRMALSYVREDILLLSLGTSISDLESRIYSTLEKAETTWNNFPTSARYHDSYWTNGTDPIICFMLLLLHLDHLHSIFLLYRLLVRKRDTGAEMLIETSRKLLSAVLVLCKERSRLVAIATDFPWIILYYGLPSAAILSAELYRQQQQQQQSQQTSAGFLATNGSVPLPRAELIRNLSVFVSAMEWASSPSDGNYSLCCKARRHLSHVLDEILDQQASLSTPPANSTSLNVPGLSIDKLAPNGHAGVPVLMTGQDIMSSGITPSNNQLVQINGLDGVTGGPDHGDDWQNMEFFLDGLADNNVDLMDWNLGL